MPTILVILAARENGVKLSQVIHLRLLAEETLVIGHVALDFLQGTDAEGSELHFPISENVVPASKHLDVGKIKLDG